jgi:S1-C subfamily serine protease
MITAVEPGSPAAAAGLMSGDMIVALDRLAVTGADDLIRILTGERIGRPVDVEVLRLGKRRSFGLVPAERAGKPQR